MSSFFSGLTRQVFEWLETDDEAAAQRPDPPQRSGTRGRSVVVQRARLPYWQERGWEERRSEYLGKYQTRHGSWRGRITVSPAARIEVFIENPPTILTKHPHWKCFQWRGNNWYFVHAPTPIPDVSAAILGIEKTINEAYDS